MSTQLGHRLVDLIGGGLPDRELQPQLRLKELIWNAFVFGEICAERLVTGDDVVEGRGERGGAQWAAAAQRERHVKGVTRASNPMLKPQRELGVGQRKPLRANRLGELWAT